MTMLHYIVKIRDKAGQNHERGFRFGLLALFVFNKGGKFHKIRPDDFKMVTQFVQKGHGSSRSWSTWWHFSPTASPQVSRNDPLTKSSSWVSRSQT